MTGVQTCALPISWRIWSDKGNLLYEMFYTAGKKSGVWRSWVKVDGFFIVTKLSELRIVKEEIKKIIRNLQNLNNNGIIE